MLPPMVALALAYILVWGVDVVPEIGFGRFAIIYAVGAVVLVAGVVVHELLHGFSFVLIGRQPLANVKTARLSEGDAHSLLPVQGSGKSQSLPLGRGDAGAGARTTPFTGGG